MAVAKGTSLILALLCMAQLAVIARATRPGPMLRGGTVVLLSRPRSGGFLLGPRLSVESDTLDRFADDSLARLLGGPAVLEPQLLIFGRQPGPHSPFAVPRRPCPFGPREPEAMLKHMAAARFGPDLLSSLLASAEAEEQREALDAPIYTIDPTAVARASMQPRRLGGADFTKEGPFRGAGPTLEERASEDGVGAQGWARPRPQQRFVTTLSSGFGVSETAAARLTPGVVARVQQRHGVRLSVDRMQLGASRSFPMVTVSGGSSEAVEAAAAEVHAIVDEPLRAAHQATTGTLARWGFRDFVSRVGAGAENYPGALPKTLLRSDAVQRAAFEGRLSGSAAGAAPLLPPGHQSQPPPLPTWDLFQDDGQLNSGALVFLFLCVACAVVWSRLLVLWCAFRHGGRRGRRCRWRRWRAGRRADSDATRDGLQAPLLNPLQHEAPLPHTQPFKVEVAAKHTPAAPFNNYVTLEYVPLRNEQ